MEKQFRFDYEHYAALSGTSRSGPPVGCRRPGRPRRGLKPPYSKFRVGAAARLRSGRILHGGNIESEVFPAGLCAERTLLFYAAANYADDPIESLAIASEPSERECYPLRTVPSGAGGYRTPPGSPIRVIMSGGGTASIVDTAENSCPLPSSCNSAPDVQPGRYSL